MNKNPRDMTAEELVDMVGSKLMGLDDTFEFGCRKCGSCCKERDDILLSPYDVFRLAKFFGRGIEYIIDRYCELYLGLSPGFLL